MFQLQNVKYKNILDISNLQFNKGKTTSIVGESGSGKTTLLKLLNRMTSPTEGSIFYEGKNIEQIDPIELRRKVVMLPQNVTMFDGTIKDNLLIGLEFSEKPLVGESELREVMNFFHLNKYLNENVHKLSGGEKQRVALCRMMLLKPEVFLLDEPSSALDEELEDTIIGNIVKYSKENRKTLIMVTHSRKVAKDYSDYIVELERGKIRENGEI